MKALGRWAAVSLLAAVVGGLVLPTASDASERRYVRDSAWLAKRLRRDRAIRGLDAYRKAAERRTQVLVRLLRRKPSGLKADGLVPPTASPWHGFRVGAERLYPASAFKPIVAAAALLHASELVGERAALQSVLAKAHSAPDDQTAAKRLASIVSDCLVWSDNRATNALYDLAGQDRTHALARKLGLGRTRIVHRMGDPRPPEAQRRHPAMSLCPPDAESGPANGCKGVPARRDKGLAPVSRAEPGTALGVARRDPISRKLVPEPFDLGPKNRMPLTDLQTMLVAIVRPDLVVDDLAREALPASVREVLAAELAVRPDRDGSPRGARYDVLRFKPVVGGLRQVGRASDWRVWSKAGRAYGFRVENAYVEHIPSGRAFLLTVSVYADDDGTVNDNRYVTSEVADPFIHAVAANIARVVATGRGAPRGAFGADKKHGTKARR